ncbi:putative quinol monooxygenase [Naasia sp. SYSU D00057]|uniref:putative quinol monooxygenase n=1 Tax=Naasia sp. SYSU D00057 TaxID=2817380 RepID=UPI001B31046A|nr:putative quinol monooxygenase [Naasia sp. SYSU D00057]
MYMVFVTLDVQEDRLDEFIEGITLNARASLADEPGCLHFDVHRSATEPARFHFYELYRDREAFEIEHRAAPHYAEWRKVVDACVVAGSHVNTYGEPMLLGADAEIAEKP